MRGGLAVAVVIPALNEEKAIGKVVSAIPTWVDDVVVVDNVSEDRTAEVARAHGARVVSELRRGYGSACLTGIRSLKEPDVVVFMDGDFSDYPGEMIMLVDPIARDEADMVIGSRVLGRREAGALTAQARFGNRLACGLMRLFWRVRYTDLGPFRAIRYQELNRLNMRDLDYGWTVEMQIKAACRRLRVREVPVSYRKRIGKSKISGTVKGTIGAGTKILSTIFLSAIRSCLDRDGGKKRDERLILFTRYPEPGRTKTRLISALGAEGAAELQRRMTIHTVKVAREFASQSATSIEVRFEGGERRAMEEWLGEKIEYHAQGEGDLGERMGRAFEEGLEAGIQRAVIIGTDCPGISVGLIQRAFEVLREKDVVLGPATDGGYYLIGMRSSASRQGIPALFAGIAWGTGEVLSKTVRIADEVGLSYKLLEELEDVDRPEDLAVWEEAMRAAKQPCASARISVVIPSLNEAEGIGKTVAQAKRGDNVEILVIDGQSDDGTGEVARANGAKVIRSPAGRARQMNAGAAIAKGDILLFLHSDTSLPEGYDEEVRRIMGVPGVAAGAFSVRLDAPSFVLRLTARLATLRAKLMQMPYGDQAIFVRAELLCEAGGFRDIPIMEEFELVRRLRRRGRIVISRMAVTSSARRWLALGKLRATLINHVAVAAYYLGVSPQKIAAWYYRIR